MSMIQALMNVNGGVASPQQAPIQQGLDPMAGMQQLPAGTIPGATPPPQVSYNPSPAARQARSLEELLFRVGGGI